jgi:hypothetical protein
MNKTFYGLAREWFRNDRFYKFYMTEKHLLGTKVGGQFFNKLSVRAQLGPLYLTLIGIPFVEALASWADNRRARLEAQAEQDLDLAAQRDDALVIALYDIEHVKLSGRRHSWTMWLNSGTVRIARRDGSELEFVLMGNQDHEGIRKTFEQHGISVAT